MCVRETSSVQLLGSFSHFISRSLPCTMHSQGLDTVDPFLCAAPNDPLASLC